MDTHRALSCWRRWPHLRQQDDGVSRPGDDGMVIAETAIAIPVLMSVAAALVWGLSLVGTSLGMADTARQIARDVGRGVGIDDAVRGARVPDGQRVSVDSHGEWVTVRVSHTAITPLPFLDGLTVPLEQTVTMPREWSW